MHEKGKIACLLANEFEDSEFQVPCDWLSAAGYPIEIIGAKAGDTLAGREGTRDGRSSTCRSTRPTSTTTRAC